MRAAAASPSGRISRRTSRSTSRVASWRPGRSASRSRRSTRSRRWSTAASTRRSCWRSRPSRRPSSIARSALAARVPLTLAVDSAEGAARLAGAAGAVGQIVDVWIEIDSGLRRAGVLPADAPALARAVAAHPGAAPVGDVHPRRPVVHGTRPGRGGGHRRDRGGRGHRRGDRDARHRHPDRDRERGLDPDRRTPRRVVRADRDPAGDVRRSTTRCRSPSGRRAPTTARCRSRRRSSAGLPPTERSSMPDPRRWASTRAPTRATCSTTTGRSSASTAPWRGCPRSTASCASRPTHRIAVGDRIRIVPNHVCTVTNLGRRFYGLRGDRVSEVITIDAAGGVH